jgi:hypothetical protein
MKKNETKKVTATETKKVSRNIETENATILEFINSLKHDIFAIVKTDKQAREILQLQFVENATVAQRAEIWVKKQRGYADMYIGRSTTLFASAEKLAYKDALQHKMSKNEIMLTFNSIDELKELFSSVYTTKTVTKKKTTNKKEEKSA